jgi:hypothetical protein
MPRSHLFGPSLTLAAVLVAGCNNDKSPSKVTDSGSPVVDEDACEPRTWFLDDDGDGFGDARQASDGCEAPEDHVSRAGDCDDAHPAVHPDAAEVCDDGIDNDCDTIIDGGCLPAGLGDAVVQVEGGGDAFGHAVDGGDVTGDGVDDLVVGAPLAGPGKEGVALVFAGPLSGTVVASDAVASLSGTVVEGVLGLGVSVTKDVDGDGIKDIFVGAPGAAPHLARDGGTAYLITTAPSGDLSLPADAHATFSGAALGDGAGTLCDGVGEIDGDGVLDFVFGAPFAGDREGVYGQVYLVHGPVSGDYALPTDADTTFYGAGWALGMGNEASSGDVTGDGIRDLVLPASRASSVASDSTNPGTVYVMAGPLVGDSDVSSAHAKLMGTASVLYDKVGRALDRIDLDHDGADDLAIGAPHVDSGELGDGAVHIFIGPVSPGAQWVSDADSTLTGTAPDAPGTAVVAIGDTTGDGREELAITSTHHNDGAGQVWGFE